MSILLNTAISALDTPTSLLPFFVKDAFNVTGRTVMAYNESGKHEAREKFIDDAGTSLFWIGGIPFLRWVANQLYKNKIDSEIHFKRINQDGIQNYFADELTEAGKNKFTKQDLSGIELGGKKLAEVKAKLKNTGYIPNVQKGFYKKFHIGATAAAVLINLITLSVALPQLNLLLSRKIISKETKKHNKTGDKVDIKYSKKESKNESNKTNDTKNKNNPSFGSLKDLFKFNELFDFASMAEAVQLTPVTGMLLLDYGISGSRVTITPRNNDERIENAIKEGGIIFFFYYATGEIKKCLAKIANKFLKTPIDIDYKIMNCPEFLAKMKNHTDEEDVLNFVEIRDKDAEVKGLSSKAAKKALKKEITTFNELKVIKMIDKELSATTKDTKKENVFKNFTLQMAQKEGLINVEYDDSLGKWIRHSKKYIETEKVIALNGNLRTFYEKAFKGISKIDLAQKAEKVISKTKKVKIASIFINMAICCASLSFIIPKIQYIIREHRTKTKSAPGIKMYQDLAQNNQLKV